ncbi:cell division initiation protein [Heliophilum fasciatum]|uniref:Cell division initiation protein n=2 Tax=Heliophilum fasciatum TaxID=35700 RepID=A0A4R2REY3_9FIRM|nr:DivIVA domain-containing protein [Heliophilum fasciatum]TCP62102.1 cell division initiation protein [Heliophilum fasciatum]
MLTPIDIGQKEFKRSALGYKIEEVDAFLDDVAYAYEGLFKECQDAKEKIAQLEEQVTRYRKLEETLSQTLLLAQKASEEVRQTADRQADLCIGNARLEAEKIIKEAEEKKHTLERQYEWLKNAVRQYRLQYRAMLIAQLEAIPDDDDVQLQVAATYEPKPDYVRIPLLNIKDEQE